MVLGGLLQAGPRRAEAAGVDHHVPGLLARARVARAHVQLGPVAATPAPPHLPRGVHHGAHATLQLGDRRLLRVRANLLEEDPQSHVVVALPELLLLGLLGLLGVRVPGVPDSLP